MSLVYSSLNHPQRVPLAAEVHSRPFLRLTAPESLTHLAVYASEEPSSVVDSDKSDTQHTILLALCEHFGVAGPGADAKYFFHDFGRFRFYGDTCLSRTDRTDRVGNKLYMRRRRATATADKLCAGLDKPTRKLGHIFR